MRLPTSVKMGEMGPRDGLQNEPQTVPAAVKIRLIESLADDFPELSGDAVSRRKTDEARAKGIAAS